MKAYHIIGFKSLELGQVIYKPELKAQISEIVAARFEEIRQAGIIHARRHLSGDIGRSTWEDDLADDDQFVFLSVGPRYADQVEGVPYGFVFDAEDLVRRGAILGIHDLASDYTRIVGEVAEEVAATLPRLPRISDEELDEFMALMGEDDPHMRQFISDNSTNPENELLDALNDGNTDYPGYGLAIALIRERIADLHREKRLVGEAALAYLKAHPANGDMEILVRDVLDLSQAIGVVVRGKEEIY